MLLAYIFSAGDVFGADRVADRIDANAQSVFVIASDELRFHLILGDVERRHIRQRAFQTVADLNDHLAVLDEHEQDDSVAFILLSDAPRFRDALSVGRNVVVALHFRKNRDHDLIGSIALELREFSIKLFGHGLRNQAGVIVDVVRGLGRNDFCS